METFNIDVDSDFFKRCEAKLERYCETEDSLKVSNYEDLWCTRIDNSLVFHNGSDLVLECSAFYHYEENLRDAVIWLLNGAVDPLMKYCRNR